MLIIGELKRFTPKKEDAKVKTYYKGFLGKNLPLIAFEGKGKNEGKILLYLDSDMVAYIDKKSKETKPA